MPPQSCSASPLALLTLLVCLPLAHPARSDGVPFVGTLLGGEQGASVYRFSGEDWQLASSPGSLKAHSTLRLAAGFYYNSFSYPVPLRAAFDDASNSYKTSVWRLDGRDT